MVASLHRGSIPSSRILIYIASGEVIAPDAYFLAALYAVSGGTSEPLHVMLGPNASLPSSGWARDRQLHLVMSGVSPVHMAVILTYVPYDFIISSASQLNISLMVRRPMTAIWSWCEEEPEPCPPLLQARIEGGQAKLAWAVQARSARGLAAASVRAMSVRSTLHREWVRHPDLELQHGGNASWSRPAACVAYGTGIHTGKMASRASSNSRGFEYPAALCPPSRSRDVRISSATATRAGAPIGGGRTLATSLAQRRHSRHENPAAQPDSCRY